MNARSLAGIALAILVGGAVYFFWPKEKLSPEDEVRQLIARMVDAAERRSPSDVVAGLDDGFRGQGGADKAQIKALLVGQFFRATQVVVLNPSLEVQVQTPTAAHFKGTFLLTRDGSAATYVIEGEVEKTDGWHLTSATWSQ